ncbi:uncharacterized protein TNCT_198651 [Trichonephila clavata]|uniref:Uncharacterized protein n=1 Tax=Trichonephila clavata TaxID=2740835 RepID=A0A8X6GL87_TRICU|nr:uncharacterized protein TNCT_198651 [Trichonephila clavata]
MLTLKELTLVKLAAGFFKDCDIRRNIFCSKDEIWNEVIKERISAFGIPLKLQEDIIALLKPIELEIIYWMEDHIGIFTDAQEFLLDFSFNPDGTVNRVKTADFLIHSKWLDVQTRFVLACQYWSSWDVRTFFRKLRKCDSKKIRKKYSTANENLNEHEKSVAQWLFCYRNRHIKQCRGRCYQHCIWTYVSLQSRLLDHLLQEERLSLLEDEFENTDWIHVQRFCLLRMSEDHREVLLKRFPLKVLRIFLFWPCQRFFLDAANEVWDHLLGNHFTCLLHIIICQKILELWKDFDYVNLLREFWHKSPDHLKQYVERTDIFEILMKIYKNGFHPKNVPGNFFLHIGKFNNNALLCDRIIEKNC